MKRIKSVLLGFGVAAGLHANASNAPDAPILDGIRSAIQADIKAHQTGRQENQRVEDDQTALNDLDDVEGEDLADVVRSVKNVRAVTASEIVRHQCDLFLQQARKRQLEDQQRFTVEAEKAIHRATEAAVNAKNTADLDPAISDLRNLAQHTPRIGR